MCKWLPYYICERARPVTEVSTLITDYLLACLSAILGLLLLRAPDFGVTSRLWGWAFLASALAAFLGGTYHGFQELLPAATLFWMWKAVVYLIGLFGLAAVSGTIVAASTGRVRLALLAVMFAVTFVYFGLMVTRDEFIFVVYFNAAAMVFLLVIHLYTRWRWGDPASPWMVAGILVSALAAAIQVGGISLHRHFNNNDLFHVIQMIGAFLFFRGAARLRATPGHALA